MDSKELKYRRRYLRDENKKWAKTLALVPLESWPATEPSGGLGRFVVWRSRDFLVQGFLEKDGMKRLSVCRTELDGGGKWKDGISWEDLQRLKAECGFADWDAVEVYPREQDVVNVANMRHLWVFPEPLNFGWRASVQIAPANEHTAPDMFKP